jgi:hypothetical protein
MRIDWFLVGSEHWEGVQHEYERICKEMKWHSLPYKGPMMPMLAIKEIVEGLKMPGVTHVAYSHELAPYGLIGIRAHYKNADVDLFSLDMGSEIHNLCAFVTETNKP